MELELEKNKEAPISISSITKDLDELSIKIKKIKDLKNDTTENYLFNGVFGVLTFMSSFIFIGALLYCFNEESGILSKCLVSLFPMLLSIGFLDIYIRKFIPSDRVKKARKKYNNFVSSTLDWAKEKYLERKIKILFKHKIISLNPHKLETDIILQMQEQLIKIEQQENSFGNDEEIKKLQYIEKSYNNLLFFEDSIKNKYKTFDNLKALSEDINKIKNEIDLNNKEEKKAVIINIKEYI